MSTAKGYRTNKPMTFDNNSLITSKSPIRISKIPQIRVLISSNSTSKTKNNSLPPVLMCKNYLPRRLERINLKGMIKSRDYNESILNKRRVERILSTRLGNARLTENPAVNPICKIQNINFMLQNMNFTSIRKI